MRATRAALVALLASAGLLPGPARADVCQASTSGTWGPIDGGSVAWSCGTGTPDAGDHFVVPAGVTVTVVDDLVQSAGSPFGIRVADGATLAAAVSAGTGALTLRLGAAGLDCAGTCSFEGGHRTSSLSPPSLEPSLDASGASWPVGDVIPCAATAPRARRSCASRMRRRPSSSAASRGSFPERTSRASGIHAPTTRARARR